MSAGELSEPGGKDGLLTPGYVTSYEHFHQDGTFKVFPTLNANNLNPGELVTFELVSATLNDGSDTLFVPVAVINTAKEQENDELKERQGQQPKDEEEWNLEWEKINETKINNANVKKKLGYKKAKIDKDK